MSLQALSVLAGLMPSEDVAFSAVAASVQDVLEGLGREYSVLESQIWRNFGPHQRLSFLVIDWSFGGQDSAKNKNTVFDLAAHPSESWVGLQIDLEQFQSSVDYKFSQSRSCLQKNPRPKRINQITTRCDSIRDRLFFASIA